MELKEVDGETLLEAERGWWCICGVGQHLILSPNLSKRRKPRKCSPDSAKRPGRPALRMEKEAATDLPAAATEPHEEMSTPESGREQACPQRDPSVHRHLVNPNICRAVSERLQFFPRGHGVRFRAWCYQQVPPCF